MLNRIVLAIGGVDEDNAPHRLCTSTWGVDVMVKCGIALRTKGEQPSVVFHTTHHATAQHSAFILAGILGARCVAADARLNDAACLDTPKKGDNPFRDSLRSPEAARDFFGSVAEIQETDETILIVRDGGWGMTFGSSDKGLPWWPCSTVFAFDIAQQSLEFVDSHANSI